MALITRLPRTFRELHYGSEIELNVVREGAQDEGLATVTGVYAPPLKRVDESATDGSPEERGLAKLVGKVSPVDESGKLLRLRGDWEHVSGPLTHGEFEMNIDLEARQGHGWWAEASQGAGGPEQEQTAEAESKRHSWRWVLPDSAQLSLQLPSSSRSGGFPIASAVLAMLVSLVNSIWLARWAVLCAEIFFVMNFAGTIMAVAGVEGTVWVVANILFNLIFTVTYASFLLAYAALHERPSHGYIGGVALYFAGYAAFLILYLMTLREMSAGAAELYVIGSVLFLVGSMLLLAATWPAVVSPLRKETALFYGSACFLAGSVPLCFDSLVALLLPTPLSPETSHVLLILALFIFTCGRVFFLRGSTTPDCSMFFKRSSP